LLLARIYANKKLTVIPFDYNKAKKWYEDAINKYDESVDTLTIKDDQEIVKKRKTIEREKEAFISNNIWHEHNKPIDFTESKEINEDE